MLVMFFVLFCLLISYILVQEWCSSNYCLSLHFGIILYVIIGKYYNIMYHSIKVNALSEFLYPLFMDLNCMMLFFVSIIDILLIFKTFSSWKLLTFNFLSLPPPIIIKMMLKISTWWNMLKNKNKDENVLWEMYKYYT